MQLNTPRSNWQWVGHFNGQDFIFRHNSYGIRGADLTTNDLAKDMIFVYGGSTTYDIGVTQGKTWAERLQLEMSGRYTVLNFGVPGYSTTEHLIQTAFYESIGGKRPVCAVYYVGWNDIRNAHIEKLDRAYADFHLPSQIDALEIRKPVIWGASTPRLCIFLANQLESDLTPFRRGYGPRGGRNLAREVIGSLKASSQNISLQLRLSIV